MELYQGWELQYLPVSVTRLRIYCQYGTTEQADVLQGLGKFINLLFSPNIETWQNQYGQQQFGAQPVLAAAWYAPHHVTMACLRDLASLMLSYRNPVFACLHVSSI